MNEWVAYESENRNLRWEKNKVTGGSRNEENMYSLAELKQKLRKAQSRVVTLEQAIRETEDRAKNV